KSGLDRRRVMRALENILDHGQVCRIDGLLQLLTFLFTQRPFSRVQMQVFLIGQIHSHTPRDQSRQGLSASISLTERLRPLGKSEVAIRGRRLVDGVNADGLTLDDSRRPWMRAAGTQ